MKINSVNIYAPPNLTERYVFVENLREFILPADSVIIGGDFNFYESNFDNFGGKFSPANYVWFSTNL